MLPPLNSLMMPPPVFPLMFIPFFNNITETQQLPHLELKLLALGWHTPDEGRRGGSEQQDVPFGAVFYFSPRRSFPIMQQGQLSGREVSSPLQMLLRGPRRLGCYLRRRFAIISVTSVHTLVARLPKQLPVCAWLIYILTRFKSTPLSSIIITQISVKRRQIHSS